MDWEGYIHLERGLGLFKSMISGKTKANHPEWPQNPEVSQTTQNDMRPLIHIIKLWNIQYNGK